MSDIFNTNWLAMTDKALLKQIGDFIQYHRLQQNKTQGQLAEEAGINRTTLSTLENGKHANVLTLVQVLRALNQLQVLQVFEVNREISPLKLAEMQQAYRKRASGKTDETDIPESDW